MSTKGVVSYAISHIQLYDIILHNFVSPCLSIVITDKCNIGNIAHLISIYSIIWQANKLYYTVGVSVNIITPYVKLKKHRQYYQKYRFDIKGSHLFIFTLLVMLENNEPPCIVTIKIVEAV